ncbi:hypothetical protein [Campylobacter sp. MG1]|uniref:DUF459 domain-containing protein n=1 Tax=Campylobacter sp. MG1 TaxID=2976332 RepID=UPI00226CE012|nr:hypothetical protein [Campylobacter sp. MG1]
MREFILILITSSLLFIGIFNDSLKEYYYQTYHKPILYNNIFLSKANEFRLYLENNVFLLNKDELSNLDNFLDEKQEYKIFYMYDKCHLSHLHKIKLIYDEYKNIKQNIVLKKDDGLILLGDSLMQGVGVAICNKARKKNIKCENIAKQSTGLLRKKYYDYAKVLDDTLSNKDIRNIVMLVGVNDLWDASENKKLLKFGDKEWIEFYIRRINELVEVAQKYNANLFWYELPVVKNEIQNDKVRILNDIFLYLSNKRNYHFIKLNPILTEHFDFYIKIDGKSKKIRSNDGIHFTPYGYALLSDDFFKKVEFQ